MLIQSLFGVRVYFTSNEINFVGNECYSIMFRTRSVRKFSLHSYVCKQAHQLCELCRFLIIALSAFVVINFAERRELF
jgi:hypothetical protein